MKGDRMTAKKFLLFVILTCAAALSAADTHATNLGINAGVLLPSNKFNNFADTGFTLGTDIKLDVYETLHYGLALNYNSANGNNGVDFWEIDLYPFFDWILFRKNNYDIFTRAGIGLSYWESDGIWWLDDRGYGVTVTLGLGCKIARNFDIFASFTNLYADFDVNYFLIRLGYNFDLLPE
jgi:hypothetical protein